MLNITAKNPQGSIAAVIASARDLPARVLPLAASTALTRTAKRIATEDMPAEMQRAFDRPTRWTLNSLRITPATRETLSARIFVKNEAGAGVPQENYLLPGVEGGGRREKAFERSLRYAGVLGAGERVVAGRNAPRDASGNTPTGVVRSINAWARSGAAKRTKASGKGAARVKAQNARGYFLFGRPGGRVRGVAQRTGGSVLPLLIFTKALPQYRPRLDFSGVSERGSQKHFPAEFARAAADIMARRR